MWNKKVDKHKMQRIRLKLKVLVSRAICLHMKPFMSIHVRGKAIKARICEATVATALQHVAKYVCGPSSPYVSAVHPKTLNTSINTDIGRQTA